MVEITYIGASTEVIAPFEGQTYLFRRNESTAVPAGLAGREPDGNGDPGTGLLAQVANFVRTPA
jgi:hypothetical protein